MFKAYTDGACSGNPGVGGYGFVIYKDGKFSEEFSQGYRNTTNNRMELMAVIHVLEKYNNEQIEIWTDSEYAKNGITEWIKAWKLNNWKTSNKKTVKNIDLWGKMDELVYDDNNNVRKNISFHWVRGHNDDSGNEHADNLATSAIVSSELLEDKGYEAIKEKEN